MESKEMEKEIQSLKKTTLYIARSFAIFAILILGITISQSRSYATIQDYYQAAQEMNRELNIQLEKENLKLEEYLSELERYQFE